MNGRMSPSRLAVLSTLAAVLGVVSGVAAWALVKVIALITNATLYGERSWVLKPSSALHRGPQLVLAAMGGSLVISALARWAPGVRGEGFPEAVEAVLVNQSRISPRTAIAKPASAAVSIGTGGPFGAEGPIIVTGGAIGSLLGQLVPTTPAERKILLASGAAAGLAAVFGAPLAAILLAIELLLFEFSMRAFIPLAIASAVAGGVHLWLFEPGPFFEVPAHDFHGLGGLPAFALLGLLCGGTSWVIIKGFELSERLFHRLPWSPTVRSLVGAAMFGLVGVAVPRALGPGYDVIGDVLSDRLALGTVAVLLVAKAVAWWIALGSGTSGGTLAPMFLMGGAVGGLFGAGVERVAPGLHLSAGAFAVVAMAAVFGACVRAPFASVALVFEMTGAYDAVLPLLVATVIAELALLALTDHSIVTGKLASKGVRVHGDYIVDPLRSVHVGDVMGPPVAPAAGDELGASVGADEPVLEALRVMLSEEVDRLHVVGLDGTVVGSITTGDVLQVGGRRFEHDAPQSGWLPSMVARRRVEPTDPP